MPRRYSMRYLFIDFPMLVIKVLLTIMVYCTSLLGVWLVTSVVAYINGSTWLSLLSGILLFPLLPLTWELKYLWRRRQQRQPILRVLTFSDRLTLRTLALNLLFIGSLLVLCPQIAFSALSTKGDWMLGNMQGEQVEVVRQALFSMGKGLEELYVAIHPNPDNHYVKNTSGSTPTPQPIASTLPSPQDTNNSVPTSDSVASIPPKTQINIPAGTATQQKLKPVKRPKNLTSAVIPLFQKPFSGEFPLDNYFDHDVPQQFKDNNGYMITWQGNRLLIGSPGASIDGHQGYDWRLPEGTPLVAVADGEVSFAGQETPFFCPPLGKTVSGLGVSIVHTAPTGERFESTYAHLSRIDVQKDQRVISGQQIGLSGNTGCSSGAHLHFGVYRFRNGDSGQRSLIDPYGWAGSVTEPWSSHPEGASSVWLWRDGQVPSLNCNSGLITQPTMQKGNDGTMSKVFYDFSRGQESINSAACGREYWIPDNPNQPNYGIRFVYLVNGQMLRVIPTLYIEKEDGSLVVSQ